MSKQASRLTEPAALATSNEGRILIEAAQMAFLRAARQEVAENDRLGVTTHGGKDGKLIERRPEPVLKSAEV